jgi:hypothetical protein
VCGESRVTVHAFWQTITRLEKKGTNAFLATLEVAGKAGDGCPRALVKGSGAHLAIHFMMTIVFIFQF